MKYRYYILIIFFFFNITTNYSLTKQPIKWVKGVGIVNGIPKYFNPHLEVALVMMPTNEYILKLKKSIIPNYEVIWGRFNKDGIGGLSSCSGNFKARDFKIISPIFKTEQEYFYKFENFTLYISKDKVSWEKVYVKILNKKPFRYHYDYIIWKIYIKCKWIEGVYLIGDH